MSKKKKPPPHINIINQLSTYRILIHNSPSTFPIPLLLRLPTPPHFFSLSWPLRHLFHFSGQRYISGFILITEIGRQNPNCGVVGSRPLSKVVGAVGWLRGLLGFFAFGSCYFRCLADLSSFEEILTYHTSENCCQLCFWKRAKQLFPTSAISKEEICSLLSFVFAGGVWNSQARDNSKAKKKPLPIAQFWPFERIAPRCSGFAVHSFRLRLNFAFEPLAKKKFAACYLSFSQVVCK